MMRQATAADRGLALAEAVTKVTDALHRMYQNIQIKPGSSYEDEDFAIEISIPDTLCVDEVLDRCHMECIKAEEEFDIYILPKVVCGKGAKAENSLHEKEDQHLASVSAPVAADRNADNPCAEKELQGSAGDSVFRTGDEQTENPSAEKKWQDSSADAPVQTGEDKTENSSAGKSLQLYRPNPLARQRVKAELPVVLVLEKKRMNSLISACLLLTALLFTAGFIIGYGGYTGSSVSVPAAQVSLPQHKETRVTWQPDNSSGAVLKVRKVNPDIPDLHVQSETGETVPPAETPKTVLPEKGSFQPFTLRLASYRTREDAQRGLAWFQGKKLSPYLIKIDWESKGIWWSVYTGHYPTQKEAEAAGRALPVSGAIIKEMPYTNFVGLFSNSAETEDISRRIESVTGYRPYSIAENSGKIRLFAGSFVTRESAEKLNTMLKNNGINTEVVKR